LNEKKKKIRVLDFGSGFQEVFFQLINYKKNKDIIIDSIEKENVCCELKKEDFFKNKSVKINFFEKINFNKKYDYVHISDSLQYMLDWKKILIKISKKKPKFIILNNLTAGDFKTYYTEQNFYKNKLIYIFFNLNEIKKILKNYEVAHESLFLNKIKNEYIQYPQKNFKNKDKLGFPKTVVFKLNF
jgi:putative methyltransferase (TIGR04325 family)